MTLALQGLLWGLISAVSLPLGAAFGLWRRPPKKVSAALMAFGGGALLFALSIELFGHALIAASEGHGKIALPGIALAAILAGALGGLLFQALNRILENRGGFLRKQSLIRKHIIRKKRRLGREAIGSLSRVKLLRALPPKDIVFLVETARKAHFAAGEEIYSQGDIGRWLYFIERGKVCIVDAEGKTKGKGSKAGVLGRRSIFGEEALVSDETLTATALAITDVDVLRIARSAFEHLLHHSPESRESMKMLATEQIDQLDAQAEAEAWSDDARRQLNHVALHATSGEVRRETKKHGDVAMAIWLGIGLDAIPESLVIGMLVVAAAAEGSTISLAFVVGVFLANFPEAMSSAVTMAQGGMRVPKVMWMWLSLCLLTGAGAMLGTILLPDHPTGAMVYVVFAIEGLAGGAMLTMIAQTMLPEAYEQGGGPIVGLATLAGFLTAMAAKLIH